MKCFVFCSSLFLWFPFCLCSILSSIIHSLDTIYAHPFFHIHVHKPALPFHIAYFYHLGDLPLRPPRFTPFHLHKLRFWLLIFGFRGLPTTADCGVPLPHLVFTDICLHFVWGKESQHRNKSTISITSHTKYEQHQPSRTGHFTITEHGPNPWLGLYPQTLSLPLPRPLSPPFLTVHPPPILPFGSLSHISHCDLALRLPASYCTISLYHLALIYSAPIPSVTLIHSSLHVLPDTRTPYWYTPVHPTYLYTLFYTKRITHMLIHGHQ